MQAPKNKQEVIQVARQYHQWTASPRNIELYPDHLKEGDIPGSFFKLIMGMFLHLILFYLTKISSYLRMYWLVALLARVRIKTDWLSSEPRQCGFNKAYTRLGLVHLKKGHVQAAISCLQESSLVYPCCHNTSYGLSKDLAMALESHPEAKATVEDYKRVYREFLGIQKSRGENLV